MHKCTQTQGRIDEEFLPYSRSNHAPVVGGFRRHGTGGTGTTKPVVYNTLEEIRRLGEVLGGIAEMGS